jgi:NAD(P)-dependent dehydrogenase (short-subunit alcohol dehydrogenase family)
MADGSTLEGRVAIVTGASRGIGLAIAETLIDRGATVVVTSRKTGAIEAAAASLNGHSGSLLTSPTRMQLARACVTP